jgi:hypothetical protein
MASTGSSRSISPEHRRRSDPGLAVATARCLIDKEIWGYWIESVTPQLRRSDGRNDRSSLRAQIAETDARTPPLQSTAVQERPPMPWMTGPWTTRDDAQLDAASRNGLTMRHRDGRYWARTSDPQLIELVRCWRRSAMIGAKRLQTERFELTDSDAFGVDPISERLCRSVPRVARTRERHREDLG